MEQWSRAGLARQAVQQVKQKSLGDSARVTYNCVRGSGEERRKQRKMTATATMPKQASQVIDFAEAARRKHHEEKDEWHLRPEEICEFIAHHIRTSKLTYSAIAWKAGCSPNTVSRMAMGDTHLPRYSTVFFILDALGFDVVLR